MGLKGNLASTNLADVFQGLSHGHSSGLLRIQAPEGTRFIEIEDGAIAIVANTASRIPLGELLSARGLISEPQLKEALSTQKRSGELLGKILVDSNTVPRENIEGAIRFQVEEEICDLFLLKEGEYDFLANAKLDAKLAVAGGFVRLKIDPNQILQEATRRIDEWNNILKRIPDQAMVFKLEQSGTEFLTSGEGLSNEGLVLLRLIKDHRSVEAMVQKGCLGRINTNSMLIELWDANLLSPVDPTTYADIAKEHLANGRDAEAKRIAEYALKIFAGNPSKQLALQNVIDEVKKKAKASGLDSSEVLRVRSEVIKRQPSLIVKRQKSAAPYVITALIFLVLAGSGTAYYFMYADKGTLSMGEINQVGHLVARAEKHFNEKHYNKALAEFNYTLKSAEAKELREKKYNQMLETIHAQARDFIKKYAEAMESGDEEAIAKLEEAYLLFDGVPFQNQLQDSMQEAGAGIRKFEDEKKKAEFKEKLDHIQNIEARDKQLAELQNLLKENPSTQAASNIRQWVSRLADQAASAQRVFETGEKYEKMGDLVNAKQKFHTVTQDFPGSELAARSLERHKKIEAILAETAKKLSVINNLIIQQNYEKARPALEAFLKDCPDVYIARKGRQMLTRMAPTKTDQDAEKLATEAERLMSVGKPKEARAKLLALAKTFPTSQAAAKATLPVTINTQPAGAEIWLEDVGEPKKTPAELNIPIMDLTRAILRKEGFLDQEISVTASAESTVSITLERKPLFIPALMPFPAEDLAVHENLVAILYHNEIIFWKPNNNGGDLVSTAILRQAQAAPDAQEKNTLRALHHPSFQKSGKNGDLELLVPTNKNRLFRVNPETGRAQSLALNSTPLSKPIPLSSNQSIETYFVGLSTVLGFECVSLSDGPKKFEALKLNRKDGATLPGLAYDENLQLFFVPRSDGKLYAIDGKSGESIWNISLPKGVLGPPAFDPTSGHIAVASGAGKITLWDVALRGKQPQEVDLKEPCLYGPIACASGLAAVSKTGKVGYVVKGGEPIWSPALKGTFSISPVVCMNKFLAVTAGTELILMDPARGSVVWHTSLPVEATALACEGKTIFVSTKDANIRVFEAE